MRRCTYMRSIDDLYNELRHAESNPRGEREEADLRTILAHRQGSAAETSEAKRAYREAQNRQAQRRFQRTLGAKVGRNAYRGDIIPGDTGRFAPPNAELTALVSVDNVRRGYVHGHTLDGAVMNGPLALWRPAAAPGPSTAGPDTEALLAASVACIAAREFLATLDAFVADRCDEQAYRAAREALDVALDAIP